MIHVRVVAKRALTNESTAVQMTGGQAANMVLDVLFDHWGRRGPPSLELRRGVGVRGDCRPEQKDAFRAQVRYPISRARKRNDCFGCNAWRGGMPDPACPCGRGSSAPCWEFAFGLKFTCLNPFGLLRVFDA